MTPNRPIFLLVRSLIFLLHTVLHFFRSRAGHSDHGGRDVALVNHRVGPGKFPRFWKCDLWFMRPGLTDENIWTGETYQKKKDVNVTLLAGNVCKAGVPWVEPDAMLARVAALRGEQQQKREEEEGR